MGNEMSAVDTAPFAIANRVRERVAAGAIALGIGVRAVRSGEIALLAKATGHDFLYIDTQHAVFDGQQITQIAQAALGAGVAPFVRVRSAADPDISRYLDAGILGIVAPDVVSADQARQLVAAAKYGPMGRRSVAGMSVHYDFRAVPADVQMRAENDAVMVFCMIESREGLDSIEEIAAVPGVDGLYLGLGDLLADMGIPGEFTSPEVGDALRTLVDVTRRHGLVAGSGGAPSPQLQLRAIAAGVRFLMTSSDLGLIRSGADRARRELLAGLPDGILADVTAGAEGSR
ncbi:aldolase [Microbacterium sp. SYP-A9085]|nr:aldolase [Microbacterium sp. SYP-A9085]